MANKSSAKDICSGKEYHRLGLSCQKKHASIAQRPISRREARIDQIVDLWPKHFLILFPILVEAQALGWQELLDAVGLQASKSPLTRYLITDARPAVTAVLSVLSLPDQRRPACTQSKPVQDRDQVRSLLPVLTAVTLSFTDLLT